MPVVAGLSPSLTLLPSTQTLSDSQRQTSVLSRMPGGFVREVCTNHGLVRLAEGESVCVLSFSRQHVEDALRISRRHRGVSSTDGLPFLGSHTVYECWLKRNDRSCSMTLLIVLSRVVRT